MNLHRLIVSPGAKPGRFVARLEGRDEIVVQDTSQPVVAAARVLLARGFSPDDLLTMRHQALPYDSFVPAPIGQWAGVRVPADGQIASARPTGYCGADLAGDAR